MNDWAGFWQIVLYVALGAFALMSLWVIVAGYRDIHRMFAALRERRDEDVFS